jgi:hypothetical protein
MMFLILSSKIIYRSLSTKAAEEGSVGKLYCMYLMARGSCDLWAGHRAFL